MDSKLAVIVKESGLEKNKAQFMLDKFQDYFNIAAEWEEKAKNIVVTKEDQTAEMDMARVGRLFLRDKRIAIEKARKELKEQALREGKAIDGIANVLKALIVPIEEYLGKQERFVEIQDDIKRQALIAEAEKKAEDERIEAERIQLLHQERVEILLPYKQWWPTEFNINNFGTLAEDTFNNIISSLKQDKADYEKEQERIRTENKRLLEEAEEKDRLAKEEKEAHEKELAKEKAKADAEKQKHEAELQKERELVDTKRKEAEKKADDERARLKKEADAKIEAERKEKERLAELLKNQITCPKCGHKFQLEKEK